MNAAFLPLFGRHSELFDIFPDENDSAHSLWRLSACADLTCSRPLCPGQSFLAGHARSVKFLRPLPIATGIHRI